jgi:hypothetical protein
VRTQPRKREYGAALFFLKRLGKIKTTFQPRLQLKQPLDMSYVLRFESEAESKPFRLVPKLDLFADAEKGTGEFISLPLITRLAHRLELTFENEEEYHEKGNSFATKHGLTLDYALNDTQGLGWAVILGSENHPFHLSTIHVSTSFGHEFYRDLFRYVFSPFLVFAKSKGFKGNAGVSLSMHLVF